MSTDTPFSMPIKILTSLAQDSAVDFFRSLLWAEASRVGIGRNLVHVPGSINEPDGGIDATIRDANPSSDEVIPNGLSGFQIKSSDLRPSKIKKELHVGNISSNPIKRA